MGDGGDLMDGVDLMDRGDLMDVGDLMRDLVAYFMYVNSPKEKSG